MYLRSHAQILHGTRHCFRLPEKQPACEVVRPVVSCCILVSVENATVKLEHSAHEHRRNRGGVGDNWHVTNAILSRSRSVGIVIL